MKYRPAFSIEIIIGIIILIINLLDAVHQGVDKAFRRASITFCVTHNSQCASRTARCGIDRASRSVASPHEIN